MAKSLATQQREEHYADLMQLTQNALEARAEWQAAKEKASELKKDYDSAVDDLLANGAAGPNPQSKLQFEEGDDDEG